MEKYEFEGIKVEWFYYPDLKDNPRPFRTLLFFLAPNPEYYPDGWDKEDCSIRAFSAYRTKEEAMESYPDLIGGLYHEVAHQRAGSDEELAWDIAYKIAPTPEEKEAVKRRRRIIEAEIGGE